MQISELPNGAKCKLNVKINGKIGDFNVTKIRNLSASSIVIGIDLPTNKPVSFAGTHLSLIYKEDGSPYKWNNVEIIRENRQYVLRTTMNPVKINRRYSSRCPVNRVGELKIDGKIHSVNIKDLSVTGIGLTRTPQVILKKGENIRVSLSDEGYMLNFLAEVVRMDGHTYGCILLNPDQQLTNYLGMKRRRLGLGVVKRK